MTGKRLQESPDSGPLNTSTAKLGPKNAKSGKRKGAAASIQGLPPVARVLSLEPEPEFQKEQEKKDNDGEVSVDREHKEMEKETKMSKEEIMDKVTAAVGHIMQVATGDSSKLNKGDILDIGVEGQTILAMVAKLNLRLAEAETRLSASQARTSTTMGFDCGLPPTPALGGYAQALRSGGTDVRRVTAGSGGSVLAVYPTEGSEKIKTADDTQKTLKTILDPAKMRVQVSQVRRVGNAGVVIQTTTKEGAEPIKKAEPALKAAGLRIAKPKRREPLVALRNLDEDLDLPTLLSCIRDQILQNWSEKKIKSQLQGSLQENKNRPVADDHRAGVCGGTSRCTDCPQE